jgi:hypothetical protein
MIFFAFIAAFFALNRREAGCASGSFQLLENHYENKTFQVPCRLFSKAVVHPFVNFRAACLGSFPVQEMIAGKAGI